MRIAFYPAQLGKVWNGDSLETEPLGGSETAVIYVARELAKLGHEVIVFSRGEPGLYHEVLYLPFEEAKSFLRTTPLDALICSRDPLPLLWSCEASKRLLWLHDLPQGRYPEADAYVFVSMWQAQVYVQNKLVPQERARVIGNGIDPDLFPHTPIIPAFTLDDTVDLVWTSNPERGLWHAAEVLHRVRKTYPNAVLNVYGRNDVYGWNTGYEHAFYPDDMTGVVLHEPMSKAQLAKELGAMDLWVYPTWWPETYCIAAVEAQAAGVPVVASAFGALNETCLTQALVPGSMRDADPNQQEAHLSAITNEALALIADQTRRERLAQAGRAYALEQSWAKQALRWETLIRQ